jgi:hypothetical protein
MKSQSDRRLAAIPSPEYSITITVVDKSSNDTSKIARDDCVRPERARALAGSSAQLVVLAQPTGGRDRDNGPYQSARVSEPRIQDPIQRHLR